MEKLEGHRNPKLAQMYRKPHSPAKKTVRAVIHFEDGTGAEIDVESVQLAGNAEPDDIGGCVREALASGRELVIRGRVRKLRMSTPFGEKS